MNPRLSIAFLTGMSNPGNSALSPDQTRFVQRLAGPGRELVTTNFPYTPARPYQPVPLALASWRNLCLHLRSRRPEFAERYRPAVMALIERTEHCVFLAGSCGLELFNNLNLPVASEARCTLICHGPVARRPPRAAAIVAVQGSWDLLSRACYRWATLGLPGGHLGYLNRPEFLRICRSQLHQIEATSCCNTSA